jgi:hypothetical protein
VKYPHIPAVRKRSYLKKKDRALGVDIGGFNRRIKESRRETWLELKKPIRIKCYGITLGALLRENMDGKMPTYSIDVTTYPFSMQRMLGDNRLTLCLIDTRVPSHES